MSQSEDSLQNLHFVVAGPGASQVLCGLDRQLFDSFWPEQIWQEQLKNSANLSVLIWQDNQLCGFYCLLFAGSDAELLKIAILPSFRRSGLASRALEYAQQICRQKNCQRILLEVEKENLAASRLYQKCGYQIYHIRKKYYANGQDALCLQLLL